VAYLDGRLIPASQLALPVFDAGVVLGASVTEMLRTFNHRIYRLEEHLARLAEGLRLTSIHAEPSVGDLGRQALDLVGQNGPLLSQSDELGINIFVTAGHVATYRRMSQAVRKASTAIVHTFPLDYSLYAPRMRKGARLVTVSVHQLPDACIPPSLKCRSRMHYWLAEREARRTDAEAIPLLLDFDGHVRETPTANLLIIKGRDLISPPVASILPGVSRAVAIKLGSSFGLGYLEQDLFPEDVAKADEAILTSTPYCAMSVVAIDGRPIGRGIPGPVYETMMRAWSQEVGVDIPATMDCTLNDL
jgi:branched-subunit amino acid aminotransferase/4-amino-4-deoxychorismate lyase